VIGVFIYIFIPPKQSNHKNVLHVYIQSIASFES